MLVFLAVKMRRQIHAFAVLLYVIVLSNVTEVANSFSPPPISNRSFHGLGVVPTAVSKDVLLPTTPLINPELCRPLITVNQHEDKSEIEDECIHSEEQSSVDENQPIEHAERSEREVDKKTKADRLDIVNRASFLLSRKSNGRLSRNNGERRRTSVGPQRIGSATIARKGKSKVSRLTDAIKQGASSSTPSTEPNPKKNKPSSESKTGKGVPMLESPFPSKNVGVILEGGFGPQRAPPSPKPYPGTVLIKSGKSAGKWKPADRVSVRVATKKDDMDIANLRLSVFSGFSPEMRKTFCFRSCQVLASRRERGASCLVATVPRYGNFFPGSSDIVLGSAECSFHEFHGTGLGKSRLPNSIMYVTEVAVSPSVRRKGIGMKIMKGIDKLATVREVETLFLHVDVSNDGALYLYKEAGYEIVETGSSMFAEFTKSLNLHDGATKGRNHFLLWKDMKNPNWLPQPERATLGFEVLDHVAVEQT